MAELIGKWDKWELLYFEGQGYEWQLPNFDNTSIEKNHGFYDDIEGAINDLVQMEEEGDVELDGEYKPLYKPFSCPNCNNEMFIQYTNKEMGQFGICDVYSCNDCIHIKVLDWRADSKEDLELNYPGEK